MIFRSRSGPTDVGDAYEDAGRATGCLEGVAVGDAVGRAGGGHTTESIEGAYGGLIRDLRSALRGPWNWHRPRWKLAEVSDDTAHTVAVARSMLAEGFPCRRAVAVALMDLDPRYDSRRGGLRTLRSSGDLDYFNPRGRGPGAAMRVGPIGIVRTPGEVSALVQDVLKVSTLTHGEPGGLESAVAVAAAVCSTMEGYRADAVVAFVLEAVDAAGDWIPDSDGRVSDTIRERCDQTRDANGDAVRLARVLGRKTCQSRSGREVASLGIALGVHWRDVRQAVLSATNLGGDADTRASIAGAVAGAAAPTSVPRVWVERVEAINGLDLSSLGTRLSRLRGSTQCADCISLRSDHLRVDCNCSVCPEHRVAHGSP